MSYRTDLDDLVAPWRDHPRAQLRRHGRACYRTFRPVDGNNDLRKWMALGLFLVWATITLGEAFEVTTLGTIPYGTMSAVVYSIIGVQWGFELDQLPVSIDNSSDNEDDTQ